MKDQNSMVSYLHKYADIRLQESFKAHDIFTLRRTVQNDNIKFSGGLFAFEAWVEFRMIPANGKTVSHHPRLHFKHSYQKNHEFIVAIEGSTGDKSG